MTSAVCLPAAAALDKCVSNRELVLVNSVNPQNLPGLVNMSNLFFLLQIQLLRNACPVDFISARNSRV